eukprot:CAMPEP_0170743356 /NCGR_PEP_ID=MMETSP0437-20130122/7223_1 /TAXON_ID=0 /ORGANISM="Sexangularia sp." /LENGTH=537 /DNA_ID=CAMNT_0011082017 /DNA_START=66 /DNA_END=1679 /DNA_ORIENTATION=-
MSALLFPPPPCTDLSVLNTSLVSSLSSSLASTLASLPACDRGICVLSSTATSTIDTAYTQLVSLQTIDNATLATLTDLAQGASCSCSFAYAGSSCSVRYDDYLAPYFDPYRYTILALNIVAFLLNLSGYLVLMRRRKISSDGVPLRLGQICLAMLCCEAVARIIHMAIYFDLTPAGERAVHVIPFIFLNHAFLFFFQFWLDLQQRTATVTWLKSFFNKLDIVCHVVMVISIVLSVMYPIMLLVFFATYGIFAILSFSVYDYYALKLRREMRTHSQRLGADVNDSATNKSPDLLRRFTVTGLVGSVGILIAVLGFGAVVVFDMERSPWQFFWSEAFFFSIELVFQGVIMYLFHPLVNSSMPRSLFIDLLVNPKKVRDEERARRRNEVSIASRAESQMRASTAGYSGVDVSTDDIDELPEGDLLSGMSRTRSSRRSKSRSSSRRRKRSGPTSGSSGSSSPAPPAASTTKPATLGISPSRATSIVGPRATISRSSSASSHSHRGDGQPPALVMSSSSRKSSISASHSGSLSRTRHRSQPA